MKKTYIIPDIQVQKIETMLMIAFSDSTTGAKFDQNGTSGSMDSRRSSSLWDDEEEEY